MAISRHARPGSSTAVVSRARQELPFNGQGWEPSSQREGLRWFVSSGVVGRLPTATVTRHGVENGQRLVHAGDDRHLLERAGIDRPPRDAARHGVGPHRGQGGHVQHRSHRTVATPTPAFAAPGAAIGVEGRAALRCRGDGSVSTPCGCWRRAGRLRRWRPPWNATRARIGEWLATVRQAGPAGLSFEHTVASSRPPAVPSAFDDDAPISGTGSRWIAARRCSGGTGRQWSP